MLLHQNQQNLKHKNGSSIPPNKDNKIEVMNELINEHSYLENVLNKKDKHTSQYK